MGLSVTPDRCFVNAPIRQLTDGLLPLFLKRHLQPEIGLEGDALYNLPRSEFAAIAQALKQEGLACTLHAPFFDLAPGALDPKIRAASREKLRLAFELIDLFHPQAIICHLGFEKNKHGYKLPEWSGHVQDTFQELLALAAAGGVTLALENTYEAEPSQHIRMMQALDSPYARICLDTGHLLAFAKCPWPDWRPAFPWIGHLHLHDNLGDTDLHLGMGRGRFDFAGLFAALGEQGVTPRLTLEPHSEDDLRASIETLARLEVVDLRFTDR